jgi:hypothetical protein
MNIDWTWFLVGLVVGVIASAAIKGAAGSLKSKVAG